MKNKKEKKRFVGDKIIITGSMDIYGKPIKATIVDVYWWLGRKRLQVLGSDGCYYKVYADNLKTTDGD